MYRKELRIIFLLYITGLVWLFLIFFAEVDVVLCPFRLLTTLPCPACGTTRALVCVARGYVGRALLLNPNIVFILPAVVIYTVAGIIDLLFGKSYIPFLYGKLQALFNNKRVLIAFLLFESLVWLHNLLSR